MSGGAPHFQAGQQFILAAPSLAAGAVGAHRQVGDQAHGHAVATGCLVGTLQAAFGQPLAKGMELDLGRVGAGKGFHFRVVRVVPGLGPVAPVGAQAMLDCLGLEHLEATVVFQRLATGCAEAVEIAA